MTFGLNVKVPFDDTVFVKNESPQTVGIEGTRCDESIIDSRAAAIWESYETWDGQ